MMDRISAGGSRRFYNNNHALLFVKLLLTSLFVLYSIFSSVIFSEYLILRACKNISPYLF